MEIFRKILYRFFFLMALLFLANLIYEKTSWPQDIRKHADLLDSLEKVQYNTDILFLSSSSNYFHPKADTSSSTISQYLNQFFPELKVNSIHKGYMHAGVFYSVLKNIPEDSPIKTIVATVNLRSFGAYWVYSNVETSYSSQQLMMSSDYPPLLRRFLLSLDYYDNKTDKEREQQFKKIWTIDTLRFEYPFQYKTVMEWDYAIHNDKFSNLYGIVSKEHQEFTANIVKAFAYNIDTITHPRIQDFDEIVRLAKKRNWNLVLHILPEDIEKANNMVGKEIPYLLNNSRDILIERYKNKDVEIVDNLHLLNASFFYEKYPTEHYSSAGKMMVAQEIAHHIKKLYPKKYKKVEWEKPKIDISLHEIAKNIKIIKSDSLWYQSIKKKSIEKNVSMEQVLKQDAIWFIQKKNEEKQNIKLNNIIQKIQSDSIWNNNIRTKATNNNLTYEEQLKIDANFTLKSLNNY